MSRRIVNEIPLDSLKKLINFNKIDPNSKESEEILNDYKKDRSD